MEHMDTKMRYIGEIHRLFEMISEKESLTNEEIIGKIYDIMSKDKEITKMEIKQALICRNLICE